jgi:hypothetical protein
MAAWPKLAIQPVEPSAAEMRSNQPAEVGRAQLLAAEPSRHQGAEDAGLLQQIDDVAAEAPLPGEFHAPGTGFLEKPLQRLLIDHDDLPRPDGG